MPKKYRSRVAAKDAGPEKKHCTYCNQFLTLECFHKHRKNSDGLQRYCKGCLEERRKVRPEPDHAHHRRRWQGMKDRCYNTANKSFKDYGGRGIFIVPEWLEFRTFLTWCESTYESGKTIDRINNDGPYGPTNCKWSTRSEQVENSRHYTSEKKTLRGRARSVMIEKAHSIYGNPHTRTQKVCYVCKELKPLSLFQKNRSNVDGHTSLCKSCSGPIDSARKKKASAINSGQVRSSPSSSD